VLLKGTQIQHVYPLNSCHNSKVLEIKEGPFIDSSYPSVFTVSHMDMSFFKVINKVINYENYKLQYFSVYEHKR